jgi:hypothetical protein
MLGFTFLSVDIDLLHNQLKDWVTDCLLGNGLALRKLPEHIIFHAMAWIDLREDLEKSNWPSWLKSSCLGLLMPLTYVLYFNSIICCPFQGLLQVHQPKLVPLPSQETSSATWWRSLQIWSSIPWRAHLPLVCHRTSSSTTSTRNYSRDGPNYDWSASTIRSNFSRQMGGILSGSWRWCWRQQQQHGCR